MGKLLGPKGNSMKRLQEETMTKMAVLGRGSMRNKQQEEELRQSSDPKYAHLSEDLHVEITAFAPPSEAHARIAYALSEVRKYLIPGEGASKIHARRHFFNFNSPLFIYRFQRRDPTGSDEGDGAA